MNQYQAELYHHGIKGQKWGVRRFQNSDGSLTKAGRERYVSLSDSQRKKYDRFEKKTIVKLKKADALTSAMRSNLKKVWTKEWPVTIKRLNVYKTTYILLIKLKTALKIIPCSKVHPFCAD